ncbi:hypothetical protein FACS189429_6130 [Bacteroidia bacterium]|nr:hypothetical protein FACS189429_6130 [Bacteroidia bacterium]GHV45886.1 hypothetical protein FACS1894180_8680 [Bacteroidia bacterium]
MSLQFGGRVTPVQGLPISLPLNPEEEKIAAGVINWELPDNTPFRRRLEESFTIAIKARLNWGFSLMAIADEGATAEYLNCLLHQYYCLLPHLQQNTTALRLITVTDC